MDQIREFLNAHASVRAFAERDISIEDERWIVETAQRSPTSSNLQQYSIIAVRNTDTKKTLSLLCADQAHIEQCPLFLVFCADLYRLDTVARKRGFSPHSEYADQFVVATVDTALAAGRALMAAQSLGIGGVMVGAIRIHIERVAELLALPRLVYPVMGMSLGYPEHPAKTKPRLPSNAIYHRERYSAEIDFASIEQYDAELLAIGYLKGREVESAKYANFTGRYSWQEHSSRRLASDQFESLRPNLLHFLRKQGFLIR